MAGEKSIRDIIVRIVAEFGGFKNATKDAENDLKKMGDQANKSSNESSNAIDRLTKHMQELRDQLGGVNSGFQTLSFAVQGLATMYGGKKIFDWLTAGNIQFEQFATTFEVVLKSADAAQEKMEWLADFAAKTPFELPELTQASLMMETYGLQTEKYLRDAGDLASAFKAQGASINEVAIALGRLKSGDFGEAFERFRDWGIGYDKLKEVGLKFSKSNEYKGTSDEALAAIQKIVQRDFGGMMEKQSKTIDGRLSTLKDEWHMLGKEVGKDFTKEYGNAIDEIAKLLAEFDKRPEFVGLKRDLGYIAKDVGEEMVEAAKMLAAAIAYIARNWDDVKSAMKVVIGYIAAMTAMKIITAIVMSTRNAFLALRTAIAAVNVALSATKLNLLALNPYLRALLAIVAISGILIAVMQNKREEEEKQSEANLREIETLDRKNMTMQENMNKIDSMISKQKKLQTEIDNIKRKLDSQNLSQQEASKLTQELASKQQELTNISAALAQIIPGATVAFDDQGRALANNIGLNQKLRDEMVATMKLQYAMMKEKAKLELPNLKKKKAEQEADMQNLLDLYTGKDGKTISYYGFDVSQKDLLDSPLYNSKIPGVSTAMKKFDSFTADLFNNKDLSKTIQMVDDVKDITGAGLRRGQDIQKLAGEISYLEQILNTKDFDSYVNGLNSKLSPKSGDYKAPQYKSSTPSSSGSGSKSKTGKSLYDLLVERQERAQQLTNLRNEIALQGDELAGNGEGSQKYEADRVAGLRGMYSLIVAEQAELRDNFKKFNTEDQLKAQMRLLQLQKEANDLLLQIKKNTAKVGEFNMPSELSKMTLAEYKLAKNPNLNKSFTIANAQIVIDVKQLANEEDVLNMEDILAQRLKNMVDRGGY